MERTETKISRSLLDAVRERAAREGREEAEVIEEALRRYLLAAPEEPARQGETFDEIFTRVKEWQRRQGVEPLSDEEAMKLAVEEQHAQRAETS